MPPQSFIEKRIQERFPVGLECVLSAGNLSVQCMTRDVSAGGVRLTPKDAQGLSDGLKVTVGFEPFGEFNAQITWISERDIGVRFEKDAAEMAGPVQAMMMYG